MDSGDLYNLSEFSMCAHNGTHVDAPLHFIKGADPVDKLDLETVVGKSYVAGFEGVLGRADAENILREARGIGADAARRILIRGDATVTDEAAEAFADACILLIGVESQSVGPIDAPMNAHRILLGAGTILLEGLRLDGVPCGEYLLCAAPLKLSGLEGAPCRAILIKE